MIEIRDARPAVSEVRLNEDDEPDEPSEMSSIVFSDTSQPPTHATCSSGMYGGTEPARKVNCSL